MLCRKSEVANRICTAGHPSFVCSLAFLILMRCCAAWSRARIAEAAARQRELAAVEAAEEAEARAEKAEKDMVAAVKAAKAEAAAAVTVLGFCP